MAFLWVDAERWGGSSIYGSKLWSVVVLGVERVQWGRVSGWPARGKTPWCPCFMSRTRFHSGRRCWCSWACRVQGGGTGFDVSRGCVCKNRPVDDTLSPLPAVAPPPRPLHQHRSIWKPFARFSTEKVQAWSPQASVECLFTHSS